MLHETISMQTHEVFYSSSYLLSVPRQCSLFIPQDLLEEKKKLRRGRGRSLAVPFVFDNKLNMTTNIWGFAAKFQTVSHFTRLLRYTTRCKIRECRIMSLTQRNSCHDEPIDVDLYIAVYRRICDVGASPMRLDF